jgi:hypothetical protein
MHVILKKMSGSVMNQLTRQERAYRGEQEVSWNFTTQQKKTLSCHSLLHVA